MRNRIAAGKIVNDPLRAIDAQSSNAAEAVTRTYPTILSRIGVDENAKAIGSTAIDVKTRSTIGPLMRFGGTGFRKRTHNQMQASAIICRASGTEEPVLVAPRASITRS